MGRCSDRLPSNLFQLGSDLLLPQKGRSIEFLNGTGTALQEGDEFLMVPLIAVVRGIGSTIWEDHLLATMRINKVCDKKGGGVYKFSDDGHL